MGGGGGRRCWAPHRHVVLFLSKAAACFRNTLSPQEIFILPKIIISSESTLGRKTEVGDGEAGRAPGPPPPRQSDRSIFATGPSWLASFPANPLQLATFYKGTYILTESRSPSIVSPSTVSFPWVPKGPVSELVSRRSGEPREDTRFVVLPAFQVQGHFSGPASSRSCSITTAPGQTNGTGASFVARGAAAADGTAVTRIPLSPELSSPQAPGEGVGGMSMRSDE